MKYDVDWDKPIEWNDGTPCKAASHFDSSIVKKITPASEHGLEFVYIHNGCMYNEGPKGTPYVRNVKEKEVNRHNFSNMSDQDLADELKEAEAILQAISDELINREFEIDNGRYDVPDAGMITKTIELEINRP